MIWYCMDYKGRRSFAGRAYAVTQGISLVGFQLWGVGRQGERSKRGVLIVVIQSAILLYLLLHVDRTVRLDQRFRSMGTVQS